MYDSGNFYAVYCFCVITSAGWIVYRQRWTLMLRESTLISWACAVIRMLTVLPNLMSYAIYVDSVNMNHVLCTKCNYTKTDGDC